MVLLSYTDLNDQSQSRMPGDPFKPTRWERGAPYLAEYVGTFLITIAFICNFTRGDEVWGVTSDALMVMGAVFMFGHISGGNINPSVSITLWLCRRHTSMVTILFCLVQVFGAATAAMIGLHFAQAQVDLGPKPGFGVWEVMILEILYTAMICFVYLNCAASKGNNPTLGQNGFVGLAAGLTVVAGGYASAAVSGTVMNPAVAVGLQIVDLGDRVTNGWGAAYLPFEIAGAFLAVGAYRVVRPQEFQYCDGQRWSTSSKVMAEFIGTFYIVLTKALNSLGGSKAQSWSVAAAIASMVYALRGVSGGHFNPAVTLAAGLSKRGLCTARETALYVGAQVLAGLSASTVYGLVHHQASIPLRAVTHGHPSEVILGEMLFTALLCYVVLTNTMAKHTDFTGLAVGGCALVSGIAVGDITGSVLNPAVAIGFTGLNALGGHWSESPCFLYIVYEAAGALLATGAFIVTHGHLYNSEVDSTAPRLPLLPQKPYNSHATP